MPIHLADRLAGLSGGLLLRSFQGQCLQRQDRHRVCDLATPDHRHRLVERDPAGLKLLGTLWIRHSRVETAGDEQHRSLVGDRVGQVCPAELAPLAAGIAGFLRQLAPSRVDRLQLQVAAALWDLPRVSIRGVAVLADQQDAVMHLVQRDHAHGHVLEMNNAVDPGSAVGSDHVVVIQLDPRVRVDDVPGQPLPRVTFGRRVARLAAAHCAIVARSAWSRPVASAATSGTGGSAAASRPCSVQKRREGSGDRSIAQMENTMNDNSNSTPEQPVSAQVTAPGRSRGEGGLPYRRIIALTAAASLLIGIVAGPIIANHTANAADPTASGTPEHTVSVSGTGTVSVAPDVADVYIGVSVTKPSARDARNAAAVQMTAVIAAIKTLGVADKDIVTTNVSLSPVYDYSSNSPRLTGYQYANTVKVTVRDLTKVADVLDGSVSAGATTINGVTFRLNDPTTVEAQARNLAMADAKSKADALAKAAGVSVKGVASINEVTTGSPIMYNSVAAAGVSKDSSTPIQTGTTDIQIQVTVSYVIG